MGESLVLQAMNYLDRCRRRGICSACGKPETPGKCHLCGDGYATKPIPKTTDGRIIVRMKTKRMTFPTYSAGDVESARQFASKMCVVGPDGNEVKNYRFEPRRWAGSKADGFWVTPRMIYEAI